MIERRFVNGFDVIFGFRGIIKPFESSDTVIIYDIRDIFYPIKNIIYLLDSINRFYITKVSQFCVYNTQMQNLSNPLLRFVNDKVDVFEHLEKVLLVFNLNLIFHGLNSINLNESNASAQRMILLK